MTRQIAIYGAFDRFNYGDLLFAVVLEQVFRNCEGVDLAFYGLRESDLSRFGGKPTRSVRELFRPGNLTEGSVVIVAGGEVLGVPWFKLHRYILPQFLSFPLRVANRLVPPVLLDGASRIFFRSRLELPFVLGPDDFSPPAQVVYNTVGGSSLSEFPADVRQRVTEKLRQSAYISVRDRASIDLLQAAGVPADLVPDSAMLISELFPPDALTAMISRETRSIMDNFPDGYLCFQVSDDHARDSIALIARELDRAARHLDVGVVLLPIGRAAGHEDQFPLGKIRQAMQKPTVMPAENGIFDIMALIAGARCFAGTSLHGNITALSFGIPHLGLTDRVPKLEAFLNTWAVAPLNRCVSYDGLAESFHTALGVPGNALDARRSEMIGRVRGGFNRMRAALGLAG